MKGVAIFLAVFGHCIQYGNGQVVSYSEAFFDDVVFKIIYSFHMPLFALVSGYLFYWSVSTKSPREVLIRQVNNLILPAVSWTVLYHVAISVIHIYKGKFGGIDFTLQRIYNGIFSIWFLWAMFYASILVLLVREKLRDSILVYVLIPLLLIFVPNRILSSSHAFMFPYFAAGYLWHRERMDEKFSCGNHKLLCTGVILAWCIMLLFYDRDSYVYTTGTALFNYEKVFIPSQFWTDIFRWIVGFAGCGTVLILLKITKPVNFIAAIGTKSLGIYIISGYIISYMSWQLRHLSKQPYIVNFLQAVIITAVCYAVSEAVSRVKILNKIFFGGR